MSSNLSWESPRNNWQKLIEDPQWAPAKATCPKCGRSVPTEFGFFATHREDPPSTVVCQGSGASV